MSRNATRPEIRWSEPSHAGRGAERQLPVHPERGAELDDREEHGEGRQPDLHRERVREPERDRQVARRVVDVAVDPEAQGHERADRSRQQQPATRARDGRGHRDAVAHDQPLGDRDRRRGRHVGPGRLRDESALIRHGELGRPQADDVAEAQDTDTLDALAVDEGAVRGAEVLDRQHAARAARHPGVAARELRVIAQPPVDVGGGTPDQQLTVDREPRARCLPDDDAHSLVRHGRATLRLPVRGHHPSVTRMIVLPGTRGASGPSAAGASGNGRTAPTSTIRLPARSR